MSPDRTIESVLEVNPEPIPDEGLGVAEASQRTGVSVHTLRYYDRAGLVVTPLDRTAAGHRRYHRVDLKWIGVCTSLRAGGMPIRELRRYAELVAAGRGNEAERLALLEAHRAAVVAQRETLEESLRVIDKKIRGYRERVASGDADRAFRAGR